MGGITWQYSGHLSTPDDRYNEQDMIAHCPAVPTSSPNQFLCELFVRVEVGGVGGRVSPACGSDMERLKRQKDSAA